MKNLVLLVIILISSIDVYLNVKYPVTPEVELNFLAKWLLTDFGFAAFFAIKFFFNSCLVLILCILKDKLRLPLYNTVLFSVFAVQTGCLLITTDFLRNW